MRNMRIIAFKAFLVMLVVTGTTTISIAQIASEATIRNTVRRIQTRTDSLQRAIQNASDRGNYSADDLNRLVVDFESSVNQLDRRLASRRASASDAQALLDRAVLIDNFVLNNRVGGGSQRDWQSLRADLDQLASYYNISTRWGSSIPGGNDDYNLNDAQIRQLIQRINSRTTNFSRIFRVDLNRVSRNDRSAVDEARRELAAFESALVQLRNRVNSRQSTASDARNLLDHAAFLNNFVAAQQLAYSTERHWTNFRPDLARLASAFNIAWNWTNTPGIPDGDGSTRRDLTGTFRYNASQGDDARRAVDAATRNLSLSERQRVYDALLRRLDPPQMLAIERRGRAVTIASTRAPQINFTADGREQVETTPGGQQVRVRADLTGDTLTISRSGERANDFTVTFDPTDNGRQLLVTRTLHSDRINQPVTVRTYYDRISDVAQLNIYDTNREDTNVGGGAVGSFIVPNGTQIVGVLNTDLNTQNVRDGDRFTMTVRSPGQFEGATIEGHVTSVDRGGRVTGRSEMTFNFDTIRMANGQRYSFAGILESVRTPDGEVVRVDNEGAVRENNQTKTTVTRTAIGTAVGAIIGAIAGGGKGAAIGAVRSEEHTSELQSPCNLVCRLLLEKK